ncbi:transmembrane protein 79-like isoform 1-T3 [Spinachia spinachia]
MSLLAEDAQCPTGSTRMQDSGGLEEEEEEEGEGLGVRSALMEPDTLQWPGERQTGGQTGKGDRKRSASWTESERGQMAEGEMGGEPRGEEGAEPGGNYLPDKAARVFSPAVTVLNSPSSPRGSEAFWEMESEKSPFLASQGPQGYNQHGYRCEWSEDTPPGTCGRGCASREVLKAGVSLMTSALFFPLLVWGGFVFLPFDAPLLVGAPLRLVYTLRCSVFAAAPIVLGWLVLGVSRLRSGDVRPLFEDEGKEAELHEVTVHQRFVSDSASLFLIYFLQLVVMAMYLTQDQLKLIPLLTIVFALGRLVYWVAAAFSSSIRAFGFGLSFLPSLAMMAANFYFIFSVEASGSVFVLPSPAELLPTPPAGKQRFWG